MLAQIRSTQFRSLATFPYLPFWSIQRSLLPSGTVELMTQIFLIQRFSSPILFYFSAYLLNDYQELASVQFLFISLSH